jgi:ABC-type multidrug transport system fused ATPase/permease subunit
LLDHLKKIFILLSLKNKKNLLLLSILTIIRTGFELLSIAMVIPLLSVAVDFEKFIEIYSINFKFIENLSSNEVFFLVTVTFIITYFFKTIFIFFYNYKNLNFLHNLYVEISNNILRNYLSRDYLFFISNNSSKLIRNINSESHLFSVGVVSNLILILSNFFILFSMCVMLVVYNFNSFYVIISIFFLSIVIVKLNSSNFKKWGLIRQHHALLLIKKLNEIIGNIKEVIIFRKQNFYLAETDFHFRQGAKSAIRKDFFLGFSGPLIEFFGIFVFFSLFLYLIILLSRPFAEIIVLLGVFAFASLKLLPNIINIISALQNLKYSSSATNVIYEEIIKKSSYKKNNYKSIKQKNFIIKKIKFKNVSFSYLGKKNKIIENLTFEINHNDKIAIVGKTGSGKTTLLNLCSGLISPTEGKIIINNRTDLKINNFFHRIGYVSQSVYLADDTISFNVSLNRNLNQENISLIRNLIHKLDLNNILNPDAQLSTVVGEKGSKLSGGQIQRLGIARSLYRCPSILILDEATSSLDINTEKKILDFIIHYMKNNIVIFSTHRKSVLKYCNKILEIKNNQFNLLKNK